MIRVFCFAFAILAVSLPVQAAQRLGLVIGNDAYGEVPPLLKAVSDARAVSETLTAQGFAVTTVLDAPRREMNRRISEFTAQLQPGDTAFVFFAGHGVEIDGENYLLPTDIIAPTTGDRDFIKGESIALSRLLDRVRATGARTTIAVIDACRDNPFEASTGRSIGGTRGLGRVAAPEGTFVMFSAGAGQLALDRLSDNDPNENSVFTRALLPRLKTPGLELRELVADLRVEVRDLARTRNHAQFPAYYDELLGDFYFTPANAPAIAAEPDASPVAQPGDDIRADFALARALGDRAALEAFVEKYDGKTDDITLGIARRMLAEQGSETPDEAEDIAALPTPPQAPVAPGTDPRAIMRQTQQRLNELGCNAGGADGVAGPRTRTAFARFSAERPNLGFAAGDLGSERVLRALEREEGRVCPVVAAAPAPAPSTGPSMAGTWVYNASCPLFIKVNGTLRLRSVGGGTFRGTIADSLGQRGTSVVTLAGQVIKGTNDWGTATETWNAQLSADGRGYSGTSSSLCKFTATLQ